MPSSAVIKALGLVNQPNQLETPPGSMIDASNVVIRRDNVIESRRGYALYGTPFGTSTDVAKQIMEYQNRLIRYFETTLQWDTEILNNDGQSIFNSFAGTFNEVDPGLRIKWIEANKNLYFTTANGIEKISAASADDFTTSPGFITPAGGIKALDISTALSIIYGDSTGFLPVDSTVAYRVVWGERDANNNLILGTPSSRSVIYNSELDMDIRDYMQLLLALDHLNVPGSYYNDGDYVNTLGLALGSSATDLYTNLALLVTKMDNERGVLFTSGNIAAASIDSGVATINIATTNAAFGKVAAGDSIYLDGFTTTNGSINGVQTVNTISNGGAKEVTTVLTTDGSALAASGAGSYFTLHSPTTSYYVWYSNGVTTDPTPGGTGIPVTFNGTESSTDIATITASALSSLFLTSVITNTLTITNLNAGATTDATSGTSGFIVTVVTQGTSAGNINITFNTTASGTVGFSGASISSGSFRAIPVPPAPETPATHNNVQNLQDYLQLIINELQSVNNINQVADNDSVAAINPLEITTSAVTGTTTLTVNFDVSITNTDARNQFKVGDLVVLDGTWTTSGAQNISGLQTIATVGASSITMTLGSAVTNGAVTIDTTSLIDRVQWFTNSVQSTYVFPLTVTTTANVLVTINIPAAATTSTFFQIYRSDITTASGVDVLANLTPDDEMKLVYEAFPTQAEIDAGQVQVLDIVPDSFIQGTTNLYTNSNSGEGIAQANDIPPVAKDINIFKNYTWYANTRTRQRKEIFLLGVTKIIQDFNNGLHPSLTIGNSTIQNTYNFVLGVQEVTNVTTTAGGTLAASGPASYFLLNNANNATQFYVWYAIGTATDPAIAGKTGIQVDALATDTNAQIAQKTRDTLNVQVDNFSATSSTNVVTITNVGEGPAVDASAGTSGFAVVVTTQGVGENIAQEITSINAVAGNLYKTSGTADYFTLNTPFSRQMYAFWFNVSGGTMTAPVVSGFTSLPISVLTSDTNAQVATKIATAVQATTHFTASAVSNVVTATTVFYGPTVNATEVVLNAGFTISTTQNGALDVLLSNSISPSIAVNDTSLSLVKAININKAAEIVNAFYLSGLDGTPGDILLEEQQLSADPFYVTVNTDGTGSSFNPVLSPTFTGLTNTAANPTVVSVAGHNFVNGDQVLISGSNSTPTINGVFTVSNVIAGVSFTIPVNVTIAGTSGSVTGLSDAVTSNNEVAINRVYYSKLQQPEAVPVLNYIDVGSANKAILRIFPLRDSLFVFKEEGLYRISGETPPWTLALFDGNTKLISADSLSSSNNLLYGWSKQGIVTVSEAGAQLISRAIDVLILPISSSSQYPGFSTATWGIGYDSDNSYTVYTVKDFTDVVATIAYRYSNLTNTWTTFDKTDTCGLVKLEDDKLYLGAGDTNFLEQERKNFNRTDYADRQFVSNLFIGNYFDNGNSIKIENTSDAKVGYVLTQDQTVSIYTYNQLLRKLDLDPQIPLPDYFLTLEAKGGDNMRTKLEQLASKLDNDLGGTTFSTSIIDKENFAIVGNSVANPTSVNSIAHGLLTSRFISISGNSGSNPSINNEYYVTKIDANHFSVPVHVLTAGTGGTFTTLIQDFRDIQSCYNIIITLLNLSADLAFSNYNLTVDITTEEAIITSVNIHTGVIGLSPALNFVVGPLTIFQAIDTTFTYSPNTLGDPVGFKHLMEATMMFQDKTFTAATLSFSTDLLPEFQEIPFFGLGNGIFGSQAFGSNFFGGNSHSAPFRTYIPRQCQRCRYVNIKFEHDIAREKYSVYGFSLTGRVGLSSRAYRG